MKLLPLVGPKSMRALNAFNMLLVGLSMLPGMGGLDWLDTVDEIPEAEKEKLIRRAVTIVPLQNEEIEALASFVADKNNVAYVNQNLSKLPVAELHEVLSIVCVEIGKIKVSLVTEAEKKSSENSPSTSEPST